MFYKHCKADLIHCLSAIALAYESHIGGNVGVIVLIIGHGLTIL
jgi:hypothetical protein